MQYTLRFVSIVYIVLLSVGLLAHVEIIPALLTRVRRDAWLSVLSTVFILQIGLFLLYKMVSIIKRQSLIQMIKDQGSKFTYYALLLPLAVYLLLNAFITAKNIIYWSQLSYMQGFGNFSLALVLLLFCLACSESGLFPMGILSSLLCPLVLILGFFVSFANAKKKNYELLFPLFNEGTRSFAEGFLYASLPVLELFIIIIFLTPVLKKNISRKQLQITGLLIIFLMVGPTIGATVEFGPEQAAKYSFPAYEQWRIITIGRYFSHTDFFAVYQWLSGGVIRIGLFVLIASNILTKGIQKAKSIRIIYIIIFIGCLFSVDQGTFFRIIYQYFRPFTFFFLILQISILGIYLIKNKEKWKGEGVQS